MTSYKQFLGTIIIIALIGTGFFSFFTTLSTNYNTPTDGNLSNTFDNVESALVDMQDLGASFEDSTEKAEPSALDSLTTIWTVIKLPFRALNIMRNLITEVSRVIGIPDWFTYSIISIIVIVLTTITIAILTRRTIA